MSSDDYKPEIRKRLMAVRAFHPGPWRVLGGTLVDAESNPVDFDIPAVRHFFQHVLGDLENLTESERRRSVTRELSRGRPGLRLPEPPSVSESITFEAPDEAIKSARQK